MRKDLFINPTGEESKGTKLIPGLWIRTDNSTPISLPKRGGKRSLRKNIGIGLAQRAVYKIVAKFKIIYNNNLGHSNRTHGDDLDICSLLSSVLTKSHVGHTRPVPAEYLEKG